MMIDLKNVRSDEQLKTALELAGISPEEFRNRIHIKTHEVMRTQEDLGNLAEKLDKQYVAQMSAVMGNELKFLNDLTSKVNELFGRTSRFSFGSVSQIRRYLGGFTDKKD